MKKQLTVIIITLLMLLIACSPVDMPEAETSAPMPNPSLIETTPAPAPSTSPIETMPTPTSSPSTLEQYIPIIPDTALLSETPLYVLKAYYEVLKTAVDEYGYGDGFNGVVYADFVDLDNDGIPELIYICGNNTGNTDGEVEVTVYGYSECLVLHTSYQLYPTHTNEVRKATCQNGLSYLTYSEAGGLSGFDEYYTVINGVWSLALILTWNEKADIWEEPDIDDDPVMGEDFWNQYDDDPDMWLDYWDEFHVNGNLVNLELYRKAPEMELGVTSERTLWNWWGYMGEDYVYNGVDDWHIDIAEYWNTVPIILTVLESLITVA